MGRLETINEHLAGILRELRHYNSPRTRLLDMLTEKVFEASLEKPDPQRAAVINTWLDACKHQMEIERDADGLREIKFLKDSLTKSLEVHDWHES